MSREIATTHHQMACALLFCAAFAVMACLAACASSENVLAPNASGEFFSGPNRQTEKSNIAIEDDESVGNSSQASSSGAVSFSSESVADEVDDGPDALKDIAVGTVVSKEQVELAGGPEAFFTIEEIPDVVFERMVGATFSEGCPVGREDLCYLRLLHVNAEGETRVGEMVVNWQIASEVSEIFLRLYEASYPIEKICLADNYNGDDEASMQDNNTSCFNHRPIEGSGALSRHSYGMAIDVNPLYNPYNMQATGVVLPVTATAYTDRSIETPYTIQPDDYCCQLFAQRGYIWGGDWTEPKDYQHFEKW